LAERIGPQKYRIWFKHSTKLTLTNDYLNIGVPNLFIASWIENHFANDIAQAVKAITGQNLKVTFGIDPELSGQQRKSQFDYQAQLVAKEQNRQRYPKKLARKTKTPLKLSLDTFVVGSANELAYNAARAVINDQKSPFNPLFIHGGYGVGKTHLAQGICSAVAQSRPETAWLYLSAEDFANQFVLALKTKKLEAFRSRMRQTDLLAIDDIHFLASKPSIQQEFLHTFNTIDLAGKQVVLVSDAHPKMIGQLSEKLVNRFVSGMVVKIDNPDLETRREICRQHAARMKKHVPESVVKYIAENIRTNVRELEGALLKVIAFSALQSKRIDLYMAKEILAEHLARTDPIVHISDIESTVATFFGITCADIHSSKKDRTISLARHFSMYLARKHTNMSSPEIGRFMGGKNHATVLLACRKIEEQLEKNSELRWLGSNGNKISKARTILSRLQQNISNK
ncbi:MAG: chromosomal replication initiator protein DnaA, partial [Phycisphaerales bacterium]